MYRLDSDRFSTEPGSIISHGYCKTPTELNITTLHNLTIPSTSAGLDYSQSPRSAHLINAIPSTPMIPRAPSSSSNYSRTTHIRDNSAALSSDALESLYARRSETCRDLLEQISISYQRHIGMRNYLMTLQTQLGSSVEISKAELKTKYDSLIAQATAVYNEALNGLERERKDRERRLKEEDAALNYYIEKILSAYRFLELKLKTENKAKFVQNYNQAVNEAEEALKVWAPELVLTNEFTHVPVPQFCYTIKPVNSGEETARKEEKREVSCVISPMKLIDTARVDSVKKAEIMNFESPVKLASAKFLDFGSLEAKKKEIIERSRPFLEPQPDNTKEPHKHKCKYHCQKCRQERETSSAAMTENTIKSIPSECSKDTWIKDVINSISEPYPNKENITPDSKDFIGYQSFGPIKDFIKDTKNSPSPKNLTLQTTQRDLQSFTPRLEPKKFALDLISAHLKPSPYSSKTVSYSDRTTIRSPQPDTEREKIGELIEMNKAMADKIQKLEDMLGSRGSSLRSSELLSSRGFLGQSIGRNQP
jgi:hypothetical protein